jgi:hypothetical protein
VGLCRFNFQEVALHLLAFVHEKSSFHKETFLNRNFLLSKAVFKQQQILSTG